MSPPSYLSHVSFRNDHFVLAWYGFRPFAGAFLIIFSFFFFFKFRTFSSLLILQDLSSVRCVRHPPPGRPPEGRLSWLWPLWNRWTATLGILLPIQTFFLSRQVPPPRAVSFSDWDQNPTSLREMGHRRVFALSSP